MYNVNCKNVDSKPPEPGNRHHPDVDKKNLEKAPVFHMEDHYSGPRAIGKKAANLRVYLDESSLAHESKVHAENTSKCPGSDPYNSAAGNSIDDTPVVVSLAYIKGGKCSVLPGAAIKKSSKVPDTDNEAHHVDPNRKESTKVTCLAKTSHKETLKPLVAKCDSVPPSDKNA